jgi:hypothetical protein
MKVLGFADALFHGELWILPKQFGPHPSCGSGSRLLGSSRATSTQLLDWAFIIVRPVVKPIGALRQYLLAHVGVALGANQALAEALVWIGKLPSVEAEQVQDGRLQVMYARLAFGDKVTQVIGRPE